MTYEDLEAGKEFGRYLDVDGDGIPYRTYPGTHPTQRLVLHPRHHARTATRATARKGAVYVDNMQRLLRKFETAKTARAATCAAGRGPSRRGSA